MPFWLLAAFAVAWGYVLSGLVLSADRWWFADLASPVTFATPPLAARSIALCAFGGPHWLAAQAVSAKGPLLRMAAAAGSIVWSFCAGVFAMQLAFGLSFLLQS
jgi:hypothetical protein